MIIIMEDLIKSYKVKLEYNNNLNKKSIINHHVSSVYIINLFKDSVRREYVKILMNKLNINYTLVIVEKPSFHVCQEVNKLSKHPVKMTNGEVGCYLSHMWCLDHIIKNKFKNAIIFEDDIVAHKNLENIFKNIVTKKHWDFLILGCADAGFKEFNYNLPSTHNTFIYLISGEIEIGKKKHNKVKDSTLILLSKGEDLKVKAKSNTKFLVISGKPINEEIARGGPFVMNTKAEILQAVQDYHNGTFVK